MATTTNSTLLFRVLNCYSMTRLLLYVNPSYYSEWSSDSNLLIRNMPSLSIESVRMLASLISNFHGSNIAILLTNL
jgi:hypothetical protein